MILLLASGGTLGIGMLFWILMILALIGGWIIYPHNETTGYRPLGYSLLLWVLLFLLGWKTFGFPIGE